MAILKCKCGAANRLPAPPARARCGKCHHVFSPSELAKATPEIRNPVIGMHRQMDLGCQCDKFVPTPGDPDFCFDCGEHRDDHRGGCCEES